MASALRLLGPSDAILIGEQAAAVSANHSVDRNEVSARRWTLDMERRQYWFVPYKYLVHSPHLLLFFPSVTFSTLVYLLTFHPRQLNALSLPSNTTHDTLFVQTLSHISSSLTRVSPYGLHFHSSNSNPISPLPSSADNVDVEICQAYTRPG